MICALIIDAQFPWCIYLVITWVMEYENAQRIWLKFLCEAVHKQFEENFEHCYVLFSFLPDASNTFYSVESDLDVYIQWNKSTMKG